MELLNAWGQAFAFGLVTLAWASILLWRVERAWPRGRRPGRTKIVRAAKFWAIFLIADAIVFGAFKLYGGSVFPLFNLGAALSQLPFWLNAVVGPLTFFFLYDFFDYWMHRAQHKWFWKQHRVHHSITELSAFNSYFHPTEPIFRLIAIYVPMTLLFGYGIGGWTVVTMLFSLIHGYYVHSPTRLNFGSFRAVIVDNAFHRIHHSVEHHHFDKNFGVFTTIWDRLFGTAHFPSNDEWPDTGVWDFAEVDSIKDYLASPLLPEGAHGGYAARPS